MKKCEKRMTKAKKRTMSLGSTSLQNLANLKKLLMNQLVMENKLNMMKNDGSRLFTTWSSRLVVA